MSLSPPLRRLSSTNSSSKESLINAYEAEEERIINILSRKLEKLREEKIELENALEAESEAHVNRLSREISALRLAQQQAVNGSGSIPGSPVDVRGPLASSSGINVLHPATETVLDALRRENENLRSRLVHTEQEYIRLTRLNEVYREELIEHRRRVGLPVDSLIGLTPSTSDPYSQPIHLRNESSSSSVPSSPSFLANHAPNIIGTQPNIASARVPIPRPPSQIRRPHPNLNAPPSPSTTPPSSSLSSPSVFSPPNGAGISAATSFTTPPSSESPHVVTFANVINPHELTYPSVPPPSLSSSFGDPFSPIDSPRVYPTAATTAPLPLPPTIPRPIPRRHRENEDLDLSVSPSDAFGFGRRVSLSGSPLSPRGSFSLARKTSYDRSIGLPSADVSPVDGRSRSHSRVGSVERGARVAETGRLIPRSRQPSIAELPGTMVNGGISDAGPSGSNAARNGVQSERGPT